MIITPETIESQYLEVPFGADHQASNIDWVTPPAQVPGHFKVWIPKSVLLKIGVLIFGAGSEYGTICLNYGALPGPWSDEGTFARHGQVPLDQLANAVFQFAGTGQVVYQMFDPPFQGGGVYLYGAVAGGNPYKLQVVKQVASTPPVEKPQQVTWKPGTTKLVVLGAGAHLEIVNQTAKKTVLRKVS
jgi:hypothetical protein